MAIGVLTDQADEQRPGAGKPGIDEDRSRDDLVGIGTDQLAAGERGDLAGT
jgi:hypothetical protein